MQGALQRPDPAKPGLNIPIRIRFDPPADADAPIIIFARDEDALKRAYLKKSHFDEHGYKVDCEGCNRLVAGILPRRPHLDSCRQK